MLELVGSSSIINGIASYSRSRTLSSIVAFVLHLGS